MNNRIIEGVKEYYSNVKQDEVKNDVGNILVKKSYGFRRKKY